MHSQLVISVKRPANRYGYLKALCAQTGHWFILSFEGVKGFCRSGINQLAYTPAGWSLVLNANQVSKVTTFLYVSITVSVSPQDAI